MNMRYLLAISLVVSGVAACGDDEPPPPPKPGTPGGGAPKTAGPPAPKFAARMRVEDRVLDPDEKKGIRHQFRERDFVLDQNNRDPFQSFVLNQGLTNPNDNKLNLEITKKCTRDDQLVATNYSYTDLRLVGIVAQGTQRKVLMMDPGNLGHIIRRGDCVGREKAKVKDIGTGYITFEVTPDETGNGAVKQGEERSIQLYPNQMPISSQPVLDNEAAKTQTPDVAPPTVAPVLPPSPRPQAPPQSPSPPSPPSNAPTK